MSRTGVDATIAIVRTIVAHRPNGTAELGDSLSRVRLSEAAARQADADVAALRPLVAERTSDVSAAVRAMRERAGLNARV